MKKKKKVIILSIILLIIISLIIVSLAKSYKEIYTENISSFSQREKIYHDEKSYYNYLKNNSGDSTKDVDINVRDVDSSSTIKYENIDDGDTNPSIKHPDLLTNQSIITQDQGKITWKFKIKESGFYNIYLNYRQISSQYEINGEKFTGKGSDIERDLLINDKLPFNEAKNLKFSRTYEDAYKDGNNYTKTPTTFKKNFNGDEIRPKQIEKEQEISTLISDYEKYNPEPYKFYFKKGENTLSLVSKREPMIINKIKLVKPVNIKSYKDKLSEWKSKGIKEVSKNISINHEAEYIYEKNTPVLIPLKEGNSARFYPYNSGNKERLNSVGIYSWRLPGYWLSYKINAPEDGLYALTLRGKQNIKESGFVSRQVIINDEIQFKEASYIPLKSSNDLNNYRLSDGKKEYLFYLKKGENIVKFSVSLGNIGFLLNEVKDIILNLNKIYLNIIKYTSATPDFNRSYNLKEKMPDLESSLSSYYKRLSNVINIYKEIYKSGAGSISSLSNLNMQLAKFSKYCESIIYELNTFQSNISALGTWVLTEQEQPFTMDSFTFHAPGARLKRARSNIFESTWLELSRFIFSFKRQSTYAGNPKATRRIKVWITSGRDNAQILKRIIDEYFADKNLAVDLELVQKEALLKATIAGKGPDVAVSVEEGTPIDFAFRGAAYDLTKFSDIGDVLKNYHKSALTSLYFKKKSKNGLYALPEQQIFPVMFYRNDVFEKLGLTPPKTADELDEVIQKLNSSNYNFFLDSGTNTLNEQLQAKTVSNSVNAGFFSTLLAQYNAKFYSDDLTKSALGQKNALEAFTKFTDYFTAYKIPVAANFVNRFRSGEIAAGITDYSVYNTLAVFAPEIAGNWSIAKIPSFKNGSIKAASKSTAVAMMSAFTKDPNASWEFLKWWTSDDTQLEYARELETIIGAAARYTTANYKTLEKLPWPSKDLEVIKTQMENTEGIPQIPGGYMTTRQFINAFLAVVNDGLSPYETMDEYITEIDHAISVKRKEFGLE